METAARRIILWLCLCVLLAVAAASAGDGAKTVTATVITKALKKDPPIDRTPPRVALEGVRVVPQTVEIPLGLPAWPERLKQLGVSATAPRSIHVSKRGQILKLIAGGQVVGAYPVGFGRNYLNDKLEEGDKSTPEGTFHIVSRHPSKKTHRSLCVDYPSADTHRKRAEAQKLGVKLTNGAGGDICIHGHGEWGGQTFFEKDGRYVLRNWTRGCLTLNDEMMEEVYEFARNGDKVEIVW